MRLRSKTEQIPFDERDLHVMRVIQIEGAANAVVLVLKLTTGFAVGSMAILADAVHSLTDVANNGVAWLVTRLAARPADHSHPYGHRKFETIAVFGLATLLTVMAFELGLHALRREPQPIESGGIPLAVMLLVLSVNTGLAIWQASWARRLESDILRADARHTFADVLTTIVVIVGWQAAARGHLWIDTAAALSVSGLILVLAYGLFASSVPILVDRAAIDSARLADVAGAVEGVIAVRDVRSRSYGTSDAIELTVEVARHLSTAESHAIASEVEVRLREGFPLQTVGIHIEPDGSSADPGS